MIDGSRINLIKILVSIFHELRKIVSDFLSLIFLEAELARRSLIRIVYCAVILLIFIITVWALGMCMLALWLHSLGWLWWVAFLVIIGCHMFFILVALVLIIKSIPNLFFPETRKQLILLKRETYEEKEHKTN